MDHRQLIELSRRYGADPNFVIAGGGNTSLKDGNRMWVKASGHALATIGEDGFVELDLAMLRAIVREDLGEDVVAREAAFKDVIYAARTQPEKGQRPSVECVVHALFPHRYVVHTHATFANMVSCAERGEALARELWGESVIWVPYVDPGFVLAQAIAERLPSGDGPVVMVWQNHGMIVAAHTSEAIAHETDRVIQAVRQFVTESEVVPPDADALVQIAPRVRGAMWQPDQPVFVRSFPSAFASRPDAEALLARGPLIPDQIVYCKSFPLWLDVDADISSQVADHTARTGFPPKIIFVPNAGYLAVGQSAKEAQDAGDMIADVLRVIEGAEQLGGIGPMSQRDREFIDAWEVEQYRRSVAAKGTNGRLAGKVAVVTGAAQGFGKGIVESLVAEGAHVALVDLNLPLASEVAADLCNQFGAHRAIGVRADVSDNASTKAMVAQVVAAFGGIDLFIANAGVLRAGSVKTQSPEDFSFVTRVNYQGYFNSVQAVAPVMAQQNEASSGIWSDIIQINSKSGLQGSNRNGAYAGSKFGGIGLTQSFALELIDDRIKVNSICPGNFFEGPLWSDPENGLFAQYLRTGKVPGATTLEHVKRFYESKVPMGRGCRVEDVVRAILYLVEQEYETGQALPVTGGQVMLA